MPRCHLLTFVALLMTTPALGADEAKTVEQIAAAARKSVVVILSTGRDGKPRGVGAGFVVAADGLIATNLHVVGEARPVSVQLHDGKRYDVTIVHATDCAADLALIRIDAKDLVPLELGDSDQLKQGQAIAALGNPLGLEYSVVGGVVSAVRDLDGRKMIQLAVAIEPGNSGGPLLDMQGRVQGVLTMKSAVTANLGFAMPVNALKPLLKKPNPVPMARWLTIGALDPAEWKPLFGARWRQRAGRITVDGLGSGFGGRSLCLSKRPVPELPYEVAVTIRLEDESGAAGLLFHADGGDRHYGFYPSGGQLRLTRFDGPDVFSWKILGQEPSPHYRPGEWNTLKVRIEKDKFTCFVNGQQVFESTDRGLTEGAVGLAKFRETQAEFKHFQVGKQLSAAGVPGDVAERVGKAVAGLDAKGPPKPELVEALVADAASPDVLRDRAKGLERQAAQLRRLARAVHQRRVQNELVKLFEGKEEDVDLTHAALLIARLDNDELDVDAYRGEVERMARELAASLPKDADDAAKLSALTKFFFTERGFHGSRLEYYHRANSYLNEVLDDREGLPITLSILYMDLGRRIGLPLAGLSLPSRFMVKHVPAKGEGKVIDVYDGGQLMTREELEKKLPTFTAQPLREEQLKPTTKRAVVIRMLHNLLDLARRDEDADGMLRYLDVILALRPEAGQERLLRAVLRLQTGRRDEARADADWLLEHEPAGVDRERVQELRQFLNRP